MSASRETKNIVYKSYKAEPAYADPSWVGVDPVIANFYCQSHQVAALHPEHFITVEVQDMDAGHWERLKKYLAKNKKMFPGNVVFHNEAGTEVLRPVGGIDFNYAENVKKLNLEKWRRNFCVGFITAEDEMRSGAFNQDLYLGEMRKEIIEVEDGDLKNKLQILYGVLASEICLNVQQGMSPEKIRLLEAKQIADETTTFLKNLRLSPPENKNTVLANYVNAYQRTTRRQTLLKVLFAVAAAAAAFILAGLIVATFGAGLPLAAVIGIATGAALVTGAATFGISFFSRSEKSKALNEVVTETKKRGQYGQ